MNPVQNHSSMIIGGLAMMALALFGGEGGSFHFNPSVPELWGGVGLALHGFGVNIPLLDNILSLVGGIFKKKT